MQAAASSSRPCPPLSNYLTDSALCKKEKINLSLIKERVGCTFSLRGFSVDKNNGEQLCSICQECFIPILPLKKNENNVDRDSEDDSNALSDIIVPFHSEMNRGVQANHFYHRNCINDWFSRSNHLNCPACRGEFELNECTWVYEYSGKQSVLMVRKCLQEILKEEFCQPIKQKDFKLLSELYCKLGHYLDEKVNSYVRFIRIGVMKQRREGQSARFQITQSQSKNEVQWMTPIKAFAKAYWFFENNPSAVYGLMKTAAGKKAPVFVIEMQYPDNGLVENKQIHIKNLALTVLAASEFDNSQKSLAALILHDLIDRGLLDSLCNLKLTIGNGRFYKCEKPMTALDMLILSSNLTNSSSKKGLVGVLFSLCFRFTARCNKLFREVQSLRERLAEKNSKIEEKDREIDRLLCRLSLQKRVNEGQEQLINHLMPQDQARSPASSYRRGEGSGFITLQECLRGGHVRTLSQEESEASI